MSDVIRVTKIHHACLLVEDDATRLLVDPGELGEAPDLSGVDAVLITHQHYDHMSTTVVRSALDAGIPVWAPSDACQALGRGSGLHEAVAGATFTVNTLQVDVTGDRHAEVHPVIPGPQNRAYLIAETVFVTGDDHPDPPGPVTVLATPVDAPWLRATDLIRYIDRLRPTGVLAIHDGLLNEAGLVVARRIAASLERNGAGWSKVVADGESITIEPPQLPTIIEVG